MEQQMAKYDSHNLFPVGSAHHAAETGSLEELAAAEAAGKARGYPALVTLETRDDILQCVPLHVAAERGSQSVVQVGLRISRLPVAAAVVTQHNHRQLKHALQQYSFVRFVYDLGNTFSTRIEAAFDSASCPCSRAWLLRHGMSLLIPAAPCHCSTSSSVAWTWMHQMATV
jgi:hypothetical protein